jgi:hypothetical protein
VAAKKKAKPSRNPAKAPKARAAKESPAKRFASGIENLPASTVLILSRTPETPKRARAKKRHVASTPPSIEYSKSTES